MLRHLQNLNELVIYASISCGAAFFARIFPAFHYPILLVRIGLIGYCIYVIAWTEGNKVLAILLSGALILGMLGGNWDWLEIYLSFNQDSIGRYVSIAICIPLAILGMVIYGKASQK
jgi:hypothetical protein